MLVKHFAPYKSSLAVFYFSFACLLLAFHTALSSLIGSWQAEEYSHGYFIPILAFLIGWHRLSDTKPEIKPSWTGIWVLASAGLLLLVGRLSAFEPPTYYAFILAMIGLSLSIFGRKATTTLAPAFVYLFFAIPLPRLIYVALSADLQLLSSTIGTDLLQLMSIPVYQEGNIIDLGPTKLQVAEACSGLRYLFPLMSFGFLAAYLLKDAMWKRVVLFLSTIPITILMNALRITFIGVTVHYWGSHMAQGILHEFEGWTVFFLCLCILMIESWVLLRIGKAGYFRTSYFTIAKNPLFSGKFRLNAPVWAAAAFSLVFAVVFASNAIEERPEIIPSHPALSLFPQHVGAWIGQSQPLEQDMLDELRLNDYWLANYTQNDGHAPVNLYIAWYDSQHTQASAHSPTNCIPGSGWSVEQIQTTPVSLSSGTILKVSRLHIRHGDDERLVYYWFDERGRDMTDQYSAKWYLFWDSLFLHRTDGAAIRLITRLDKNEAESVADARLAAFLSEAYPRIETFIPGQTVIEQTHKATRE